MISVHICGCAIGDDDISKAPGVTAPSTDNCMAINSALKVPAYR